MTCAELRDWRRRLGLTQAEAAAVLHTPMRTYQSWEGATQPPGVAEVACELLEKRRAA